MRLRANIAAVALVVMGVLSQLTDNDIWLLPVVALFLYIVYCVSELRDD
jgi:hypothetical protein